MRLTNLAAALALSVCATAAAEPIEVTPAIPAGIAVTLWMPRFPDLDSRRQADNAAMARCQIAAARHGSCARLCSNGQRGTGRKGCTSMTALPSAGIERARSVWGWRQPCKAQRELIGNSQDIFRSAEYRLQPCTGSAPAPRCTDRFPRQLDNRSPLQRG